MIDAINLLTKRLIKVRKAFGKLQLQAALFLSYRIFELFLLTFIFYDKSRIMADAEIYFPLFLLN